MIGVCEKLFVRIFKKSIFKNRDFDDSCGFKNRKSRPFKITM